MLAPLHNTHMCKDYRGSVVCGGYWRHVGNSEVWKLLQLSIIWEWWQLWILCELWHESYEHYEKYDNHDKYGADFFELQ